MVKLQNVIDTRTGQFHSRAIVKDREAKWYIPSEPPNESEEEEEIE